MKDYNFWKKIKLLLGIKYELVFSPKKHSFFLKPTENLISKIIVKIRHRRFCKFHSHFEKLKCVFIHIPKTAGSSLTRVLFPNLGTHATAMNYVEINENLFKERFTFAFVRNPFDRLVSSYFYLKKGGMGPGDKAFWDNELSVFDGFDSFVKGWVNEENVLKGIHFVPQYYFVTDPNDEIIVDYIGRFENIGKDLRELERKMNITINLPKHNSSAHREYQQYYNEETIEIVKNVYQKDLSFFNYDFS